MTWYVEYNGEQDFGKITFNHPDGSTNVSEALQFQHGPVNDNGINGVQNEEVIELLVKRLGYLNSKFPCRENSLAITKLEEALMWLKQRTATRVAQGVEGKNEAHV